MLSPRLIVLQPTPYCNIACDYCYLGHRDDRRLMPRAVVQAVADDILASMPRDAAATIVWHAGEPLAAPIRWYEQAYEILAAAKPDAADFALQSNGIAVDERWIALFRRTRTAVSLSIDGPEAFHDARRKTRNGKPTWALAMRGLERLHAAGMAPNVITVLSPESLDAADDYYAFYRRRGITHVSFNIDETEGANRRSRFAAGDHKLRVTAFLRRLLERAYADGFPLHVREVERIARVLAGGGPTANEQVSPWDVVVVTVDGGLSTFSPESTEVADPRYDGFVFGNILAGGVAAASRMPAFARARDEIAAGVAHCRGSCRYFAVCGGGAPINKLCETGSLSAAETVFCRLSIQAAADALTGFVTTPRRVDRHVA